MKLIAIIMLTGLLTTMLGTSCSKPHEGNTNVKKTEMLTETQDTITGMMGATASKAKKNAERQIKQIETQHNEDLEKALRD